VEFSFLTTLLATFESEFFGECHSAFFQFGIGNRFHFCPKLLAVKGSGVDKIAKKGIKDILRLRHQNFFYRGNWRTAYNFHKRWKRELPWLGLAAKAENPPKTASSLITAVAGQAKAPSTQSFLIITTFPLCLCAL
jgi:hypothetical protein